MTSQYANINQFQLFVLRDVERSSDTFLPG